MSSDRKKDSEVKQKITVIDYKGLWDKTIVRNQPTWLFVYGDNDLGTGMKGQAIIRKEPNSIGIPTKKKPSLSLDSFYSDKEYDTNIEKITHAIDKIKLALQSGMYTTLVLTNTIGTGLAMLDKKAPLTYKFLLASIENLKAFLNSKIDSL